MEHFRGVIWPRNDFDKTNLYRYVVIGMLVTDQPLEKLEGKDTVVLDGYAAGMQDCLQVIPQKLGNSPIICGNANQILTNLNYIVDEN